MCLVTWLLLFLKKTFIEGQIAAFEILEMEGKMGFIHAMNALQFLTVPVFYLWTFTLSSFVLWVGNFMFGYRVTYPQTWKIVMVAHTIFFVPEILKILWFMFIETDPTLFRIREFYPFAMIQLVDLESISKAWIYPLKSLNLFEVISWILMVHGIHYFASKRFNIAVAIVFTSYVPFFLMWLLFYAGVYK